jgi:hypothetical protein
VQNPSTGDQTGALKKVFQHMLILCNFKCVAIFGKNRRSFRFLDQKSANPFSPTVMSDAAYTGTWAEFSAN